MGKKRSNLRSSSKGIHNNSSGGIISSNNNNNNNHHNTNTNAASSCSSSGAASSSSLPAIPATHHQQQQQRMQSLLFQGGNSNIMTSSSSSSADAAEKWAWLTEMAVAGTTAAAATSTSSSSSSSGNHTNGIIFPGVEAMMSSNINNGSSNGMMTIMTATSAGNSSNNNNNYNTHPQHAITTAQQYLQSLSQLLATEMMGVQPPSQSGSGSNNDNGSSNNNNNNNKKGTGSSSNFGTVANNATTPTTTTPPNNVVGVVGSAQSIGLQLEALAALMAQQQNNPTLKICVTSGSSSGSASGGGGMSIGGKHSGKKRSGRNATTTTFPTTNSTASSTATTTTTAGTTTSSLNHGGVKTASMGNNITVERMANFQQYLKVIAESYQKRNEQEQKEQMHTSNISSKSVVVGGGGGGRDDVVILSPSLRIMANNNNDDDDGDENTARNTKHSTFTSDGTTNTTATRTRTQSLTHPPNNISTTTATTTNTNFNPNNNNNYNNNNNNNFHITTTTTTTNNNNNNSNEELQSLLPIFTELVSLTNKIVTAQENGDVAQVDAATSQLCERVLKDGKAMSVLGLAMNEMNKFHPINDSGGGGGNPENGSRGSNGLSESHAFGEGEGVAGMNALLQSMIINGSTASTRGKNSSIGVGNPSMRSAITRKEELERRRTRLLAEKNEAIRKLAALGASMQTWQKPQPSQQSDRNETSLESAEVGGTGTPAFSFTFGGEGQGGISSTVPNTSTSPVFALTPPPLFVPLVEEVAAPSIPPGGCPPNTTQAAATAAAMAAFSNPLGYDCSGLPAAPSTTPGFADTTYLSDQYLQQIPLPIVREILNSAEWSNYFDACLRERGVKGGLMEFEEFARSSSQGAVMTASMSAKGGMTISTPVGAGGLSHHTVLPQDRVVPHSLCDKDDVDTLPAGFEYDGRRYTTPDTFEVEEKDLRTKKASKKRDKKARQKERAKKEAEVKAALIAMKKREKAITSWRSRVVAACMAGDSRRMDILVGESPFKNYVYDPKSLCYDEEEDDDDDHHDENGKYEDRPRSHEEYISKQMEWFLSNCLQKYRCPPSSSELSSKQCEQNIAREKLANYILSVSFDIVLKQSPSSQNRNAIHSAAYMDDVDFIRWVILNKSSNAENDVSYLECLCSDGGWTPLHYATAGGAKNAMELLFREGVCVTARTDSSLTCFKSRRGNGVTARELAIALQSGAVKDRIMSESHTLRNIVKNQLGNASTDKAAYLKNLRALEIRLANVEKYGYSPPLEKAGDGDQGDQNADGIDSQKSTAASISQTSKKKKKQQQQQQISQPQANTKTPPLEGTETSPNSNSAPSTLGDDDLTDPVAVALLGMGFSDDQIKSAAQALGGFERATADDMVVWILGEGESADSGNAPDATNDNHMVSPSEANTKSLPRANADQQIKANNAELAARKRQEEIAAAQRALEKREEQRRIRREWNEREQARQMQEKNAKIAVAMTRRHQVENAKLVPEVALPRAQGNVGVGAPPSTVSGVSIGAAGGGIGRKHHHDAGPPLTIFAGGPKIMSNTKSKAVASNMGIPQAPALLRTPKILTRPLHPPSDSKPQSQSVVGNQPLFVSSLSSSNAKPSNASPPRNILAKSIHQPSSNPRNDQPRAILRKESSAGVSNQDINMTGSSRRILPRNSGHPGPSSLALNNPGSLGASSSMANNSSTQILRRGVAPPGFIHGGSTHHYVEPSATEEAAGVASSSSFVETNPLGMIRATAREFVPTYFNPSSTSTPSDSFLPVSSNTVPSMSAQILSTRPSTVSPPPPPTRSDSNDDLMMFEHMTSLISTFAPESSTPTVQSVTSSITGPSGMVATATTNNNDMGDENNVATSRVGSIIGGPFAGGGGGGGGSGIQTSSIFESISYHGNQESNNLALGSGIWGTGSSSNVNQSSSAGLAGLNFSSFMGGV